MSAAAFGFLENKGHFVRLDKKEPGLQMLTKNQGKWASDRGAWTPKWGKTARKLLSGVAPEEDLVAGLVLLGVPPGGDAGEVAEGADKVGIVG